MAWLYDWAADIMCFLVLMSLLEALLPSKKYIRYIRFFSGTVLILVAVRPVLGGLGIAGELDRYFEEFSIQTEARDIRRDVLGIEEERRQQVLAAGEEAAEADVEEMAREAGFVPVRTEVEIERDAECEHYGEVVRVAAAVAREEERAEAGPEFRREEAEGEERITAVSPVKIEIGPAEAGAERTLPETAADEGLEELKRKVERFYELEPENVEIQLERR